MPGFTQDNRPIRVDTVLGRDELLLESFHGVENVSSPFAFHVDLLSEKPDIDAPAMLRSPLLLTLTQPGGGQRFIHGLIRRFVQLGQRGPLTAYHAEVVPWLWFLSLARECRIFQKKGVLDIVEEVLRNASADFDIRCTRTPPEREYCVQYRETHLDFVSRLLEQEGIGYFFEHSDEKHVLVLTDDTRSAAAAATPTARFHRQRVQEEDVVWSLEREHAVHTGAITLRDYDYLQPSLTLESALAGENPEEVYDYPGNFSTPDNGDHYVRVLLEAQEAGQQTLSGESNCRGFVPGFAFGLEEHYRPDTNGDYLLLRVQHFMKGSDYLARGATPTIDYQNDFLAIPASVPFRPLRRTPRPVIHGTQTALVVGPAGEEIHVDSHCRIKVQFYWDRLGQRNEDSSCWVRVATPWGGKGYGGVSIPRIGNEVVVEFLEGDPDRPLIVGSVYNAEQAPPFALPGSGIQMGMRSRSSPGGGGYNEISMTDTRGTEAMTIHAQYNQDTVVENDQTNTINNNRTTTVAVDDAETVGSNQTISIGTDQTIDVGANQTTTVGSNQTISVGSNRSVSIGANDDVSVGGNQVTGVTGDRSVFVSGAETIVATGNMIHNTAARLLLAAGADLFASGSDVSIGAQSKVEVFAGTTITLSAGGSSIEIGPGGIKITSGAMVTIQGSTIKLN